MEAMVGQEAKDAFREWQSQPPAKKNNNKHLPNLSSSRNFKTDELNYKHIATSTGNSTANSAGSDNGFFSWLKKAGNSPQGGWAEWQEGGKGLGPGGPKAKHTESKDITGIAEMASAGDLPENIRDIAIDLTVNAKDVASRLRAKMNAPKASFVSQFVIYDNGVNNSKDWDTVKRSDFINGKTYCPSPVEHMDWLLPLYRNPDGSLTQKPTKNK